MGGRSTKAFSNAIGDPCLKLVVDANIVLAALIRDSTTRRLLLDGRLELVGPDALKTEVLKHVEADPEIPRKTNLPVEALRDLLRQVSADIVIVPKSQYARILAFSLKLAPHPEDAPYLALALKEHCPVWSNDTQLKRQRRVRVLSTVELLALIG